MGEVYISISSDPRSEIKGNPRLKHAMDRDFTKLEQIRINTKRLYQLNNRGHESSASIQSLYSKLRHSVVLEASGALIHCND